MNEVIEVAILDVGVLDFAVRFHIVAARKLLAADRTFVRLRPMDIGVVPAIRHGFMATDATV